MDLRILNKIIRDDPELDEIFKDCPEAILRHWETRELQKGSIICSQGEQFGYVCLIVEGKADVYILTENGKKYTPTVLGKGNFIGEMEAFEQKPAICYVEAITDIKLLQIKKEYFIKWLELDKNINLYIIKYSYHKFCNCTQKASANSLYSLKARLCAFLLSGCNQTKIGGGEIEIELDKEKLSQDYAVSIRSIQRVFQHLSEENIIEIKAKSIVVKDLKKLALEEENSRYE